MSKENSFRHNFFVLLTGNSVGQLIPFFLAPFVGRIFAPEELAVQENFLAIVAMISIAASGRYEVALVLPREQSRANNLLSLSFLIALAVSVLSAGLYFFRVEISALYDHPEFADIVGFISVAIFLLAVNNVLSQWTIRGGNYRLLTLNRIVQSAVQNSGYVILGYLGWGVTGLILAWLAGHVVAILMMLFPGLKSFHAKDVSRSEMKSLAREYKDFPMVNSLHAFTDVFATQFLLFWLITNKFGAVALGLFAVMNRYVRSPLNVAGSAVGQLYYREASVLHREGRSLVPIFNKSALIVMAITVPAIVALLVFGPDLFALYLGEKWRPAGVFARIMAPAIFFNFLCSPVSSSTLIFQKQKQAYLFSTVGYIVSFGLLVIGSNLGFSFEKSLWMYSISLSLLYISLYAWYRRLIQTTSSHAIPV